MTNRTAEPTDDRGGAGGVGPAGRGRAEEAAARGADKKASAPEPDRGAIPFAEVFKGEWAEVCARREKAKLTPCADASAPPQGLAGLSLSGGGIRSATFCLGLLQGLRGAGVLKRFDYLSTVSGGGYVGGWWSAWLARSRPPAPERCEPGAAGRPDTWEQDPRQRLDDGDVTFPPREELAPFNGSGERPGGAARLSETLRGGRALSPEERSKQEQCDVAKGVHEEKKRKLAKEKNVGSESYRDRGSAGNDPVHHLRLFGNYLTPRKGALSADTWRAVTVISRNILLTWLVLLPLLVALILAAQLYFLAQAAVHDPNELFYSAGWRPGGNAAVLVPRLWLVVWAALGFGLWLTALICAWMITSGPSGSFRKMLVGYAGVVVVGFIFCVVSQIVLQWSDGPPLSPRPVWPWGWVFWIGAGAALLVYALWVSRGDDDRRSLWRRLLDISQAREVRRNRIVRTHAMVLVALTLTTLAMLFAGFGHELVNFLSSDVGVRSWVKKAGGWGAVLLAAGGAIYTALKTAPAGGKDSHEAGPNLIGRFVITVTPPLVLLVLGVGAAWAVNFFFANFVWKYQQDNSPVFAALLNAATCLGVVLTIYFALSEMKWRGDGARAVADRERPRWRRRWEHLLLAASAAALAVLAVRHFWLSVRAFAAWEPGGARAGAAGGWPGWVFVVAGLATCALFLILLAARGEKGNRKSLALLVGAAVPLVVFLCGHVAAWRGWAAADGGGRALLIQTVIGLIGALLTWVLAFGWMADPNSLSLYLFYKGRLVRAYIGASNLRRGVGLKDISEAVDGDDVLLCELKNCQRGAPYHLVNTTLNLVGARDLGTAQRNSDYFTLSKLYCGSAKTGYRRTEEYMSGTLKLGTAVAVSGAAASPSMGSMTFSAPLVMLMTLLNVRLGFWAPTPNKAGWRETSARFWPYYILRELLSQTNDLSAYCNLTDGGHFDNTGVYSLVARACRLIVVADCGADPTPHFSDLGTAIRRCRIDFNADIQLDIRDLERDAATKTPAATFAVGRIKYDERHLRELLPPEARDAAPTDPRYGAWLSDTEGIIIVVKPALTNARGEAVDVRQYGMQNAGFPQQSTADFWYDEAQFESYRRLGEHCAGFIPDKMKR